MPYVVVVPVKALATAKRRLDPLGGGASGPWVPTRSVLALAFARDALDAVASCRDVEALVVVTSEDAVASHARGLGAAVVRDPQSGLTAAITAGADRARQDAPDLDVAVMCADLPCLRPDDLTRPLASATEHPRSFVADHTGRGSTLLAARAGEALDPRFGPDSAARHRASGAVDLAADVRVRLDVDTSDDLAEALRIGVGRWTRAALTRT